MSEKDKTVLIIYNPAAGKGTAGKNIPSVKRMFEARGIKTLCFATGGMDDAYRAAVKFSKKYGGTEEHCYLVAVGGDGTINEVVRGVIDSGIDIPVGIIPTGSTNDFGYSLGISGSFDEKTRKTMAAIDSDSIFECDTATLNGKYFVYTVSFGLFSDVSYKTPRKLKNMLGHAAYIVYGALSLGHLKKIRTEIEYDGQRTEKDLLLGMAVSAKSVGGFRNITGRGVRLDDGMHEMMIVTWPKNIRELFGTIKQAFSLMRGKNGSEKTDISDGGYGIYLIKAQNIAFHFAEKVSFSADGEDGGEHETAKIKVFNKRVRYLCSKRP